MAPHLSARVVNVINFVVHLLPCHPVVRYAVNFVVNVMPHFLQCVCARVCLCGRVGAGVGMGMGVGNYSTTHL